MKSTKRNKANEPMHLTTMPSALLSQILREQDLRQKQVVAGDRGRSTKNMILRVAILVFCLSVALSYSQDFKSVLAETDSTDALIAFGKRFSRFGTPQWASFSNGDTPVFTIWNDPFSGESAVLVRAYFKQDNRWKLFLDTMIKSTSRVTPKILGDSDTLVFYAADDLEVFRTSLKNIKPLKP
jgi:hypothetical protein